MATPGLPCAELRLTIVFHLPPDSTLNTPALDMSRACTQPDPNAEIARLRALLAQAGIDADAAEITPATLIERAPWTGQDRRAADRGSALALQEVTERYRLAGAVTNDAIWDWDLQTNHVLWNAALCDAYGHQLDEIATSGEWWIAHIHPHDRGRVEESIHAVIEGTATTWSEAYRFRRRDGSYAQVLDRGNVVRDLNGKATRMIGAMLDMTESLAAASALRDTEERLRTLIDTIGTAVAVVEVRFDDADRPVDYCFVQVNPAFEVHAGVNLQGRWMSDYASDLEPFWVETYGRVAKTRQPASFENYAIAFGRWFDVRAVPVGDPAARQIGIFFNDTTERHRSEQALRQSEAVARENSQRVQLALAAGAIIGTWNWDLPSDQFAVDEAFAHAFGIDPALGRSGLSLEQVIATVHPEDKDGLIEAIQEVIGRGGAYAHQYRVKNAAGVYAWVEANGRVDFDAQGAPKSFPGVLINVNERRAVQAERDQATAELRKLSETLEQQVVDRTAALMQAEEQLRQSQKMEAVGQLTGGLAHDFNNLLAGITGALELIGIKMAKGQVEDIDRYLLAAQGAAKRAAALTHRLLAFSRRQTLDPKPTDVNALIGGMNDLIQRTVGPGILVETIGASGLWITRVDVSQLENALLNLCLNARDAMPDGGRITIETENRRLDREAARSLDLAEGQYLSLSVTDTGSGMSPEVISKAFDPFFTTKPIGQGTGLGLSMIYGFAKQSAGHVRIHSEVGAGTTICIYLPRYYGPAELDEQQILAQQLDAARAGETILVVDDEPTVRMLVTEVLSGLGYAVIEAGDSAAGLKILQSDAQIDLLVSDVGLPGGMNGRQMADAARAHRPELKTLFITGYAENAAIGDGHLPPGMQVMTKPFSVEALAARVRELTSR